MSAVLHYAEHAPSPRLESIVECYWILEGGVSEVAEPILPDGRAEIIFHYGTPFRRHHAGGVEQQPAAILAGQITAPVVLSRAGTAGVAAIRLRPEAAAVVFQTPAHCLTDRLLALDDVISRTARVEEQLFNARNDGAKVRVLETWLTSRHIAAPRMEVTGAVRMILTSGGAITIDSLSTHTGLSRRHLERVFQDHVGLVPKVFARIIRLRRAVKLMRRGCALAEVAAACGYYDQAHMTRDFRDLAAKSPSEWKNHGGELTALFAD